MALKRAWTDQRVDEIIALILRTGVICSSLLVFLGGILFLVNHSSETPNYKVFWGEPSDLRHISGILEDALEFRPRGMIQFGILLLIATPVMRVVFTVLAFALQKDKTYVVITLLVFVILMFSLTGVVK